MNQSLAVKYRPKVLEDVVGQESIVKILKQQLKTNNIKNSYLFCGSSGCGKAQPLTSLVFTKDGYIKMGDVTPGTLVVDGSGNETTVLNVFPQGKRPIYRIYFDDRTYIEVADNHLNSIFYTKDGKKISKVVTTLELIDLLKTKRIFVNTVEIKCWNDSNITINPYLLGCLLGDGHISKDICFTTKDQEILNKLNNIIETDYNSYFKKKISNEQDKYSYRLKDLEEQKYIINYKGNQYNSITKLISVLRSEGYPKFDSSTILRLSKNEAKRTLKKYPELKDKIKISINESKRVWNSNFGLRYELKKLGLLGSNSYTKFIPKSYLYSSKETRLSLLQGLMDTDGFVNKSKDRGTNCVICTTSKQLKEDILFLARSLGFFASYRECIDKTYHYVYKGKDERRPAHDYWEIRIKTNDDKCLFALDRKKLLVKPHEHEARRKIVSIEYSREDECQCIYLESPEHTYLTDNLTLTHNTTTARILANEINKGIGYPIEIDAASNSTVENVKSIIEASNTKSITSEYRIYIIDECHSLSLQAWQAFLKTIEEPNSKTIFIFCTTEVQKVPQTILNRVQRFDFKKMSKDQIINRLWEIVKNENFNTDEESLDYIAKLSKGRMRDAISYLEKVSSLNPTFTIKDVAELLGTIDYLVMFDLTNFIIDRKEDEALRLLTSLEDNGKDLKVFINEYTSFVLDINKFIVLRDFNNIDIPKIYEQQLLYVTNIENNKAFFTYLLEKICELKEQIRFDYDVKTNLGIFVIDMCK